MQFCQKVTIILLIHLKQKPLWRLRVLCFYSSKFSTANINGGYTKIRTACFFNNKYKEFGEPDFIYLWENLKIRKQIVKNPLGDIAINSNFSFELYLNEIFNSFMTRSLSFRNQSSDLITWQLEHLQPNKFVVALYYVIWEIKRYLCKTITKFCLQY